MIGLLCFLQLSFPLLAWSVGQSLSSYAGDYTEDYCGATVHLDFENGMLIETETCADGRSDTAIFKCNATTMKCVVDTSVPQDACVRDFLTLFPNGNILLSNPCAPRSVEWVRLN